ncbi:MAG: CNNM domain-containing protein [Planctomycetota bacterium]
MTSALVIFAIGMMLSAFFSGSETGFYRVPRMRLVIDAVGGDRTARGLLWASNHPEAFVATALVGNNVANYLASSAIVGAAGVLLPAAGLAGEMTLTLLLAPVVFIFGELLPKRAFLQAPYRLLRRCAGALLAAAVTLAAPSSILWLASRTLSLATGTSMQPLRMAVRRRELTDAFTEGQAVGLLSPAQRNLALATFSIGGKPLRDFMTPVARQPRLTHKANRDDVLRLARRYKLDAWPIDPDMSDAAAVPTFVRASRLVTEAKADNLPSEDLIVLGETTPFLQALTRLESAGQPIAAVRGAGGRITGYVRLERLQQALWDAA